MIDRKTVLEQIRGRLIVSCQALPEEAMYSTEYPIMQHFARAARRGGAGGIRANSVRDIRAIRAEVALPVIGIIKRKYGDCPVCITPTLREVEELAETGCEIIAMDATMRPRPDDERLEVVFAKCRERWPDRLWMADCATEAEGLRAWAQLAQQQLAIERDNASQGGLFDARPTLTREQLFQRLGNMYATE